MSYIDELETSYGTNGVPKHMAFTQACQQVDSLRAQLAALRRELDEARRDGARWTSQKVTLMEAVLWAIKEFEKHDMQDRADECKRSLDAVGDLDVVAARAAIDASRPSKP